MWSMTVPFAKEVLSSNAHEDISQLHHPEVTEPAQKHRGRTEQLQGNIHPKIAPAYNEMPKPFVSLKLQLSRKYKWFIKLDVFWCIWRLICTFATFICFISSCLSEMHSVRRTAVLHKCQSALASCDL